MSNERNFRSGFVALLGRPNVGKSTLLNHFIGQKVAIVSPKPQTTRHRILGIRNTREAQIVFIDTPGLHRARSVINRRMVAVAEAVREEADVLCCVIDAEKGISVGDRAVLAELEQRKQPLCVVANKIDRLKRDQLLPVLSEIGAIAARAEIVPVSALKGKNTDELEQQLIAMLPEGERLYDEETFTDQSERRLVEEVVREKILFETQEEVPYSVGVCVDRFEDRGKLAIVSATVHVARRSQKAILVGKGGQRIRDIGRAARLELEKLLDRRLYLELFVRVSEGWMERPSALREFGL